MSIRAKAILFFGGLLISIVFVDVFYVEYGVRGTFIDQTTNNFRIIAEQSGTAFLAFSEEMKTRAVDWSSDSTLRNIMLGVLDSQDNTRNHTQQAKEFALYVEKNKMPFDKNIILVELLDKEGKVIASTNEQRIGSNSVTGVSSRTAMQFSKTLVSNFGDSFVNTFVLDERLSAGPVSSVAVRIFAPDKNGNFQSAEGVLVLYFSNVQNIIDVLNGVAVSRGGELANTAFLDNYKTSKVFLINSEHITVTSARDGVWASGSAILASGVRTLPGDACFNEGREIHQEYINSQGTSVLGASLCLEDRGLALVVEVQKSEVFAPLNRLIQWTMLGVVSLFLLGATVVLFFVRLPLSRLDAVIKALEKVMKGDLNVSVKVEAEDETGHLAQMFNTMIGSIRGTQQDLEESKRQLEEKAEFFKKDLEEHKKQERFLEESKRATMNLLEDSWKTKEKLEEEGNKLQTILSSIGDGLILIDNEYKIVLVNTRAIELLATPNESLIGRDLREVIKLYRKRKYIEPDEWPLEEVFRGKKTITTTVEDSFAIETKNLDVQLPVAFSIAPITGKFAGLVIVFRDITEDREFDEAKSGFISVASHQLRTPLTSIRWYSEMLLSEDTGVLNETQKDFVGEIHDGAERLYKTVDLLLGLSRVEGGKIKIERAAVDIGALTADVVREVFPQVNKKNMSLSVNAPAGRPVIVWLDPLRLRQVLLNLFSNAINYSNENGIIVAEWKTQEGGHAVVYSVRDYGIGIPENQSGRIFSKFFRAENARRHIPDGSGLGLALVKNLVESWGGRIWFESKKDVGTTFFFTVPLTTPIEDSNNKTISVL